MLCWQQYFPSRMLQAISLVHAFSYLPDFQKAILQTPELAAIIRNDATDVLTNQSSVLRQYTAHGQSAFLELIQPPVSLVIVGAGNDVQPLVGMATILGWQITIVDGRATHANLKRFPKVHKLIVGKPAEALEQVETDERTVFVLMTHNYNYDLAMLKLLLQAKRPYIGTLGPKKRLESMLAEIQEQGITITAEQRKMLYGPTGLDIGAETPEEIALSIVAEIKAVLAGKQGSSLRQKHTPIHSRPAQTVAEPQKAFQHS